MGKEKLAQATKRTTRFSLNTCSNKTLEAQKTIDSRPPSVLNDLVVSGEEESLSLDTLLSDFPGRRPQILELLHLLGPLNSPMLPLFLYGGASTGKTSVILQIFNHLKRPFVYSSCRTCYNPRILFEATLNQLLLHRRNTSNGYVSAKRCERPADFVNYLQEGVTEVINNLKGNTKLGNEQDSGRMIYIIFDNMELVRDWDKHSSIIPMFFNLDEILKMPEVGLIFISNASLDTYYFNTGFVEPIPVYFPDYTDEELYQILTKDQVNSKLYSSFLGNGVLKSFCRITRRVDELSVAFQPLFKKYCEPLSDLGLVPNEDMTRRLFTELKPHIAPSRDEIFKVPCHPSFEDKANKEKIRKENMRKLGNGEAIDEIEFHMSVSAKYLLISAFLASRNPATLDASTFDPTGGGGNRKRRRKISETSNVKKEQADEELLMKGPGTFPLERLLALFQCITSVLESEGEKQAGCVLGDEGSGDIGLMSDVLLQLSTLCNANFICKGGNCPLEGSTRYRSTVSEEMIRKIASSVNFPLANYLYRVTKKQNA